MKTFFSLKKLIAEGRKRAQTVSTVSFDLFDTLFIRRIHDPDLVKLPVARFIANLAAEKGLNWSWKRVQKLRDTIEQRHRQETGEHFDDHEACYPRYMREALQEIFGDFFEEALLEKVTDYELAMEVSMLVPRHEFLEWLQELKSQEKRVFIISDIYLPSTHLERLVEALDLSQYAEAVISSADTFLAKASGNAFPLIRKQYNLDKNSWLHVGDNPISDGLRPTEFGIQALVINDGEEKRRKSIIKRYFNYSDGKPFWRGRVLQQLMMPLEAENVPQDPLFVEGYNFLAPLMGVFVQQIAERSRELGITKIFFLSREGWTFKQVWEKVTPLLYPEGGLPEIEYLYVSRMALAGASCAFQGLTKRNASITFLPVGNKDFRDICRIFSFSADELEPHLKRFGLTAESVLSPHHEGFVQQNALNFEDMLEDEMFQDAVKSQAKDANEALNRYLEDVGFYDHKNIALVDIGWLGTIQRFFHEAIQHRSDAPRCHGFLLGATRGIPYPSTPENYVEGVLYDKNAFDLGGSTLLYARDLFEEACRAPHPTLDGYTLTEKGYELRFRTVDDEIGRAEKEQDQYFSPLQEGIFAGAKRFGAASSLLGFSLTDYKPWLNYLMMTKLAFPKSHEVQCLRHLHHLDDFHGSKKPSAKQFKGQKTLWGSTRFALVFSPFLRLRFFLRHIKDRLNE